MTVSTNDRLQTYPGNGVTVEFDGPRAYSANDISLYLVDNATGTVTLIDTGYAVTRINTGKPTLVTLDDGGTNPSGATLLIFGIQPYAQDADLTNQSRYLPEFVEKALDKLDMQIQQVYNGLLRTLRISDKVLYIDTDLLPMPLNPIPGFFLYFDPTTGALSQSPGTVAENAYMPYTPVASVAGVLTLDANFRGVYLCVMTENITDTAITNPPPTGYISAFDVEFVQDDVGNRTYTPAVTFHHPAAGHTLSTAAGKIDRIHYIVHSDEGKGVIADGVLDKDFR